MRAILAGLCFLMPAVLEGQAAARSDSVFARARQLVNDGNGAAGRALVDSVLGASTEGSALHAEALYWRAVLSESSASAKRDYLRLAVEYASSARAPDALLRLAQLELASGDRESALRHLDRLVRDHPGSPMIARAHLWRGRALLDVPGAPLSEACSAISAARAHAAPGDAELRTRIDFYGRQCAMTAATAPVTTPAARDARQRRSSARFAVQVAAYESETDADALVTRLARRGMTARVMSSGIVHRVWIGEHATRTEAVAALQELRRARIDGFVVETP